MGRGFLEWSCHIYWDPWSSLLDGVRPTSAITLSNSGDFTTCDSSISRTGIPSRIGYLRRDSGSVEYSQSPLRTRGAWATGHSRISSNDSSIPKPPRRCRIRQAADSSRAYQHQRQILSYLGFHARPCEMTPRGRIRLVVVGRIHRLPLLATVRLPPLSFCPHARCIRPIAFSFIVYHGFEAISRENPGFNRYRKIELSPMLESPHQ